jgi:hypothetical protein
MPSEAAPADLPPGGRPVGDPPWQPWLPEEVTARLAGVTVPWCISAGWAVDLFRGEVTRPHEDVEITVPAAGFPAIRAALADLEFDVAGDGHLWPEHSPAFDQHFQTWGREPATGLYRIDVFREPHEGDTWLCRRDQTITRPFSDLIKHTPGGVPYLAPEVALLFKAKHARPKDEHDFAGALPLLDLTARAWLIDALHLVHPGHPWLATLGPSGRTDRPIGQA